MTAAVLALLAPYAVWLLGARGTIGPAATEYARISAIGLPFLYLSFAGNGHLTGQQDTRTPLRIAVGANVINVALEAVLVFGLHAGLAGSAWGTVAAQVIAAAAYARASRRSAAAAGRAGPVPTSGRCCATATGCRSGRSRSAWCRWR